MSGPTLGLTFTDAARAALARAPAVFVREMAAGIMEAQMLAEREVKERTPTSGAGTLRDSIGALPIDLSGARVEGAVGTSLAYAIPVEMGAKPHMPPLEPLADWVRRKLGKSGDEAIGIAQAIRWHQHWHGMQGAWMFRDAFAAIGPQIDAIMGAAMVRATNVVGV